MKYLLDTCLLSETVKNIPDPHVLRWIEARKPHELCTSAMSLGELQRGVIRLPESKRRNELSLWLHALEISFENRILSFDTNVVRIWAQITVNAEALGKSMAAFDSIIAATAKAHDCILVTRNIRDFANAGVEVLNPWE
jgi:predicted nucleic acid-binding protein